MSKVRLIRYFDENTVVTC